jgi:transmembrane sensor
MTGPTLDWDKLGRYLAGEASPDEAAAMRRWLEEHPSDAQVVAALDTATKGLAPERIDVEAALRRVKTRARARSLWRYVSVAVAATVVLAVGVLVTRRNVERNAATVRHAYFTQVGGRDSVALADGSWVVLGPASRLVVRGRDVELTGQAYFSVIHDPARPFTVRAGGAVIRDIGTRFTVHSDSAEAVRVVVNEGAVHLAHASDSVALEQGDVGELEPGGRVQARRGAATDADLAWTRGRLVFQDASMAELVADLRRWYGVEVRVMDTALLRRHFTGTFAGEPLTRVLGVVGLALRARVELQGDTAFIRSGPLPSR